MRAMFLLAQLPPANWLGVGLAGEAKPQAGARAGLPRKPLAAFACRGLRLRARL
jgi:hypothetical protein